MDEKSAVVKYRPPRVLRMDLTDQILVCNDGGAATYCTDGAYFIPESCGENKKGKRDFSRGR
jgi:hypothetical protein